MRLRTHPRVAVIGGGQNCEHAVSLGSAAGVVEALEARDFAVTAFTIERDGSWSSGTRRLELAEAVRLLRRNDVVFPALHGPRGEDGTVAALCELAGLPYVGSGVRAGALAMDKATTKLIAGSLGIATAPGTVLAYGDPIPELPFPLIVKPVAAGSSHGVRMVADPEALAAAVAEAFALDDRVLVEAVIAGREIDIAVLGNAAGDLVVSPPLEIVGPGIFDFATKYDGSADFRLPAPITATEQSAISEAARAMFRALGCRGLARIDFFLTTDGWVLNEVNTMPGMTAASQAPRMFAAAGISYPDLVERLVRDAARRD